MDKQNQTLVPSEQDVVENAEQYSIMNSVAMKYEDLVHRYGWHFMLNDK